MPDHELDFPFGFRPLLKGWQLLFFEDGTFAARPEPVGGLEPGRLHRERPGSLQRMPHARATRWARPSATASSPARRDGPDGKPVPNITPHPDGIGDWSKSDLVFAFQTSILPDGDVFGGAMAEVVEDGLSHLSTEDLEAIAEYLLSVEPLEDAPAAAPSRPAEEG